MTSAKVLIPYVLIPDLLGLIPVEFNGPTYMDALVVTVLDLEHLRTIAVVELPKKPSTHFEYEVISLKEENV